MRSLLLIIMISAIVFLCYRLILIAASIVITKILSLALKRKLNIKEIEPLKFDLLVSIALQLLFVYVWIYGMDAVNKKYGLDAITFYVSFCLIGAFCVIWCYFSWDIDIKHIFNRPYKACPEHRKAKKIVIYSLILLFVLCQGYYQTLHAIDSSIEVSILFSVTNYSVIVAAIALDRLMNQICS